jgi:hypothetical protein
MYKCVKVKPHPFGAWQSQCTALVTVLQLFSQTTQAKFLIILGHGLHTICLTPHLLKEIFFSSITKHYLEDTNFPSKN